MVKSQGRLRSSLFSYIHHHITDVVQGHMQLPMLWEYDAIVDTAPDTRSVVEQARIRVAHNVHFYLGSDSWHHDDAHGRLFLS